MRRRSDIAGERISIPRLVLLVAGVQLGVSVAIYAAWLSTGDARLLDLFFGYSGPIALFALTTLQFALGVAAWRQFSPGEPLRRAWLFVVLASTCHLTGAVLTHLLGAESYVNPLLFFADHWTPGAASSLLRVGRLVGGPLQMACLAAGLFVVVRAYKGLRLVPNLKPVDYALLGGVLVYTITSSVDSVLGLARSETGVSVYSLLSLLNDPLLSVLLFEAIVIRRSVIGMGWGLVARCWGAFTAAIVLTSLGDVGLWATAHEYLPWPYSSVMWFVWFLSLTAYALGPAYQMEASRRAWQQVRHAAAAPATRSPIFSGRS